MLSIGARTGYDIRRAVELSARYFWTISPVQIYPELKKLEAAGLLEGADDPHSNRRRRTYKPTRAGRAALQTWLDADEELTLELRDLGLLKLFFADCTDIEQAIARCESLARRHATLVKRFDAEILPAAEAHAAATGLRFPLLAARIGREENESNVERYARLARELRASVAATTSDPPTAA
jgi:DNA-binding PadR family transcriptional regulator